MRSEYLRRQRRWAGAALGTLISLALVYFVSPGIPVWWGPHASTRAKAEGRELFEHEWQVHDPLAMGDGLGPVYNAKSCVACHFQGGVGGGGSNDMNVTTFEIHPTSRDPEVHQGVVHKHAVDPAYAETRDIVHSIYANVGGRTVATGCNGIQKLPDFDPVRFDSVSTPALFGAGWIDRISEKAITQNRMKRLLANTKADFDSSIVALPVGRPRILADGRVGKFGWKAQFATLTEFVANACVNEIGLGTPSLDQIKPLGRLDYPDSPADMTRGQFNSLLAFVDTLPRPRQVLPGDEYECETVKRGELLFSSVGCASCHTANLGGLSGVYSDFLLYKIDRTVQEGGGGGYGSQDETGIPPFPDDHPAPVEWKTPPLWGVADSAPYFHDGHSRSLEEAIRRHAGQADGVTKDYCALPRADQEAIIAFLKTLRAPADAWPVKTPSASVQTASR
jgi:CxxC motif-containing protein (DUF1111 family)